MAEKTLAGMMADMIGGNVTAEETAARMYEAFYGQAITENRCVCCGEIIPEGRMVCPNCERRNKDG